ncbi:MAG: hypothetical protein A2W01_09625 [Candidatus Solincola sediminis]|uniref:Ferric oxidoreductase domain-containing protein n=1 Tax=Candidatus Solincola sediminis TaxID=1797199 RepID=A0A1F2WH23_9ACTN|nr:MAG: hypothetical protein A2Y75_02995 [Candidatus Solincola sediminis]OFW60486.1 MAG: hypothetical protein A2W01_09625 [Candidatus Solincola sediminis]
MPKNNHGVLKRKTPFAGNARLVFQVVALLIFAGVLAVPVVVVATSESFGASATFTSLRMLSLLAFSLIFISIVTGAFRPFFNRIFKPKTAQRLHVGIGLAGFLLGLSHGLTVTVYGFAGYNAFIISIGPTVLALLVLTMLIAFYRRRFKDSWRWIHRINYLIFGAVFTHAVILGFDVRYGVFLKIIFGIYAGIVVVGSIFRYSTLRSLKLAAERRAIINRQTGSQE